MSQSVAVSRTKQMSLEQLFKLSWDYHTGVDVVAACSIDVEQQFYMHEVIDESRFKNKHDSSFVHLLLARHCSAFGLGRKY